MTSGVIIITEYWSCDLCSCANSYKFLVQLNGQKVPFVLVAGLGKKRLLIVVVIKFGLGGEWESWICHHSVLESGMVQ